MARFLYAVLLGLLCLLQLSSEFLIEWLCVLYRGAVPGLGGEVNAS